jgi:hypothetical protein
MSNGLQTERNRVSVTTSNESCSFKYWAHKATSVSKSAKTYLSAQIPFFEIITNVVIRPLIDGLSINAP